MTAMPLDPLPFNTVGAGSFLQTLPEILILHWLTLGVLPTFPDPTRQPFGDALLDILGIGVKCYTAGFFQGFQSADGGHQFHPVIGGETFAAGQFFFGRAVKQERTPPTRTGIAGTGAIGMYFNLRRSRGGDHDAEGSLTNDTALACFLMVVKVTLRFRARRKFTERSPRGR